MLCSNLIRRSQGLEVLAKRWKAKQGGLVSRTLNMLQPRVRSTPSSAAALRNIGALEIEATAQTDLQAAVETLEVEYLALVDNTTDADRLVFGEFYRKALELFGSNEEIFAQYPEAAGLLLMLRIEGSRRPAMGLLRRIPAAEIPK